MIDGIRRRLRAMDKDPWNANQNLEPEVDRPSELRVDNRLLLAVPRGAPSQASNQLNAADLYKSVLMTAIEHNGRWGDHQIPVPWLRMILAGLDFKLVEPETMWYDFAADDSEEPSHTRTPGYDALFPAH
jgi:hypothetical protein